MIENFIDIKVLLIVISLTIMYYYIFDSDNIIIEDESVHSDIFLAHSVP